MTQVRKPWQSTGVTCPYDRDAAQHPGLMANSAESVENVSLGWRRLIREA